MSNMKMGSIIKISKQDNIMIVREDRTMTDYIVFLDSLSGKLRRRLYIEFRVSFHSSQSGYEFIGIGCQALPYQGLRLAA